MKGGIMIGSIRQDNAFLQAAGKAASQVVGNNQSSIELVKRTQRDERTDVSRAQEIKNALAKGEYKIDIGGSAAKMAQNLLGR